MTHLLQVKALVLCALASSLQRGKVDGYVLDFGSTMIADVCVVSRLPTTQIATFPDKRISFPYLLPTDDNTDVSG